MLKKLVKLSKHLYESGLVEESASIDNMVFSFQKSENIKTSQQLYIDEQTFIQPFKDVADNVSGYFSEKNLKEILNKQLCSDDFISPTLALDIAGFFPGLGEPADIANVVIALHCGKMVDAFLSALAIVPIVGVGATILKRLPSKPSTVSEAQKLILKNFENKIVEADSASSAKEICNSTSEALEKSIDMLRDFQRKAYASLPPDNPVITNSSALIKQIERLVKSIEDIFLKRYQIIHESKDIDSLPDALKARIKNYNKISDDAKNQLISVLRAAGMRVSREIVQDNIQRYKSLFKSAGVEDKDLPIIINFLIDKISESKSVFDEVYSVRKTTSNLAMASSKWTSGKIEDFSDFDLEIHISFNMPNIFKYHSDDIIKGRFAEVIRDAEISILEELDHLIFTGVETISKAWAQASSKSNPEAAEKIFNAISVYTKLISRSTNLIKNNILKIREHIDLSDKYIEYYFDEIEFKAFCAKISRYGRSGGKDHSVRKILYDFNSYDKIIDAYRSRDIDYSVAKVLKVFLEIRNRLGPEVFKEIVDSIELFLLDYLK